MKVGLPRSYVLVRQMMMMIIEGERGPREKDAKRNDFLKENKMIMMMMEDEKNFQEKVRQVKKGIS